MVCIFGNVCLKVVSGDHQSSVKHINRTCCGTHIPDRDGSITCEISWFGTGCIVLVNENRANGSASTKDSVVSPDALYLLLPLSPISRGVVKARASGVVGHVDANVPEFWSSRCNSGVHVDALVGKDLILQKQRGQAKRGARTWRTWYSK